jgi:hypothetical protein
MAKAGLYALGFVLFDVLIIGAGSPYTTGPNPFGPPCRERSRHRRRDGAVSACL